MLVTEIIIGRMNKYVYNDDDDNIFTIFQHFFAN